MTEHEWLTTGNAEELFEFLTPYANHHPVWSARKERLLGCGLIRRMGHLLAPGELEILEAAERYADAEVTELTLGYMRDIAYKVNLAGANTQRHKLVDSLQDMTAEYISHPLNVLDNVARGMTFDRPDGGIGDEFRNKFDD